MWLNRRKEGRFAPGRRGCPSPAGRGVLRQANSSNPHGPVARAPRKSGFRSDTELRKPTTRISRAGVSACPGSGDREPYIPLPSIQIAIATIIRFSVREMNPSGTLLPPPTQAHLSSRLST